MAQDDDFDDLAVVAPSPADDFTAQVLRWAGLIVGIGLVVFAISAA